MRPQRDQNRARRGEVDPVPCDPLEGSRLGLSFYARKGIFQAELCSSSAVQRLNGRSGCRSRLPSGQASGSTESVPRTPVWPPSVDARKGPQGRNPPAWPACLATHAGDCAVSGYTPSRRAGGGGFRCGTTARARSSAVNISSLKQGVSGISSRGITYGKIPMQSALVQGNSKSL
jgi:hypothetical protein